MISISEQRDTAVGVIAALTSPGEPHRRRSQYRRIGRVWWACVRRGHGGHSLGGQASVAHHSTPLVMLSHVVYELHHRFAVDLVVLDDLLH